MMMFRLFLIAVIVTIVSYTAVIVAHHGPDLLPIFFGDIAKMGWPGQFNLDFWSFLILVGLWLMWRHHFSTGGIALGLLVQMGGMPLLATYLLIQSFRTGGNMPVMLLGERRVKALTSQ